MTGLRKKAPLGAFFVFTALLAVLVALPAGANSLLRIKTVVDGDTVILDSGRHVRLIGINTPEIGHDGRPDEPLARAARERLQQLVQHGVRLTYETEREDRHRRALAHLELPDGSSVGEILLREGLAVMIAVPPNVARVATLRAAENEARRTQRGIWREAYFAPRTAATLARETTGFRLVQGRITRVGQSRKFVYLDLAPDFPVMINHEDWQKYFRGEPKALRGRAVVVRGWITEYDGKRRLKIMHPAMLEFPDEDPAHR